MSSINDEFCRCYGEYENNFIFLKTSRHPWLFSWWAYQHDSKWPRGVCWYTLQWLLQWLVRCWLQHAVLSMLGLSIIEVEFVVQFLSFKLTAFFKWKSLAQLSMASRRSCTFVYLYDTWRCLQLDHSDSDCINLQVSCYFNNHSWLVTRTWQSIRNYLAKRAHYQSSTLLFYHIFMGSIALGDIIFASNLWLRIKHVQTRSFDFMGEGFVGKFCWHVIAIFYHYCILKVFLCVKHIWAPIKLSWSAHYLLLAH